jgi:hypothetical protein
MGSADGERIEATTAASEPSQPEFPGNLGAANPTEVSVTQGVDKSILALSRPRLLIPGQAAHHNEMMSPAVTE